MDEMTTEQQQAIALASARLRLQQPKQDVQQLETGLIDNIYGAFAEPLMKMGSGAFAKRNTFEDMCANHCARRYTALQQRWRGWAPKKYTREPTFQTFAHADVFVG